MHVLLIDQEGGRPKKSATKDYIDNIDAALMTHLSSRKWESGHRRRFPSFPNQILEMKRRGRRISH